MLGFEAAQRPAASTVRGNRTLALWLPVSWVHPIMHKQVDLLPAGTAQEAAAHTGVALPPQPPWLPPPSPQEDLGEPRQAVLPQTQAGTADGVRQAPSWGQGQGLGAKSKAGAEPIRSETLGSATGRRPWPLQGLPQLCGQGRERLGEAQPGRDQVKRGGWR